MKKPKLFCEIPNGLPFYFYGDPTLMVKEDATHYIRPTGRRRIHPHVLVFQENYYEHHNPHPPKQNLHV